MDIDTVNSWLTNHCKFIYDGHQKKPVDARISAISYCVFEAVEVMRRVIFICPKLVKTVVKIPISILAILGNNWAKLKHNEMVGLTDLFIPICKTYLCFINIFIAPIIGVLSPLECIKYHEKFGLIDPVTTAPQSLQLAPTVTFANMAGMIDAKERVRTELILPRQHSKLYMQYGLKPPRGVLLYGPPGCGKSMFAEAIAGELKMPLIAMNWAELGSPWMHGTLPKIQASFEAARKQSPCVLFIDEFDSMLGRKVETKSGADQARAEEVNELLTQMSSEKNKEIIIIAATNHIEALEPAAIRPGRLDVKIKIDLPNEEDLKEIFAFFAKNLPLDTQVHFAPLIARIQSQPEGARFAVVDVQLLFQRACLRAIKSALAQAGASTKAVQPITQELLMDVLNEICAEKVRERERTKSSATAPTPTTDLATLLGQLQPAVRRA